MDMATTPKLAALQTPRTDRNRGPDASKSGRPAGDEGTGVEIRASLPPIYREQGQQGGGGSGGQQKQGQPGAVRAPGTALFRTVGGKPVNQNLFNPTSAATYWDPTVAAARWVPASATEAHRPKWDSKWSSMGGARQILFNTPPFSAGNPGVKQNPAYDIPENWNEQLVKGFTEARVNDVTDGRPMPHRTAVYNLVGTRVRA